MKRLFGRAAVVVGLCGLATTSFAQNAPSLPDFDQAFGQTVKAPPKTASHKEDGHPSKNAKQTPEEAEKAARLEEGRKKFFERSMGFDNGSSTQSPVTLGGSGGGLTPSMGMKF